MYRQKADQLRQELLSALIFILGVILGGLLVIEWQVQMAEQMGMPGL